jgi:hypothetical protein
MARVTYDLKIYDGTLTPKLNIPGVTKVTVKRKLEEPSEIEIILPTYENLPRKSIKFGDKIVWKRGYDDENETVFIGYVTEMTEEQPYTIRGKDILYFIFRNTNTVPPVFRRTDSLLYINEFFSELLKDPSHKTRIKVDWTLKNNFFPMTRLFYTYGTPSYKFYFDRLKLITIPRINYYMDFNDEEEEVLTFFEDLNLVAIPRVTISDNNIISKSLKLKKQVQKNIRVFVYQVSPYTDYNDEGRKKYDYNVTMYPPRGFNYTLKQKTDFPSIYEIVETASNVVVNTTVDLAKSPLDLTLVATDLDRDASMRLYAVKKENEKEIVTTGLLNPDTLEVEIVEFYLKVSDVKRLRDNAIEKERDPLTGEERGRFNPKDYAIEQWKKLTLFNGLVGGEFTIFGKPLVKPGDKIDLILTNLEEYHFGQYVSEVEDITYQGIKQKITLRERDINESAS